MSKLPLFGILKHRISILENISINEIEERWEEKDITFAAIKPLYNNKVDSIENFSFGHMVTEEYFLFKIRWLLNIDNKMRIKFKKRIFEIKRIIDVTESSKWLQIIALEINNH